MQQYNYTSHRQLTAGGEVSESMFTINNFVAMARAKEAEVVGTKRKREDNDTSDVCVDEGKDSSITLKKKKKKKAKKSIVPDTQSSTQTTNEEAHTDIMDYPYDVNDDDHCETPACAYEHLVPILMKVAHVLGKTPSSLKIYDPYYCEGAVIARLAGLGFQSVYNKKEDFYQKIDTGTVPEYDCLVTNPPYSADHMERLLEFCAQSTLPFFLLLPNYVYMKPYCMQLFLEQKSSSSSSSSSLDNKPLAHHGSNNNSNNSSSGMFFVTTKAHQRYLYTTPKGRRQKKSGKYTAPFPVCRIDMIPLYHLQTIVILTNALTFIYTSFPSFVIVSLSDFLVLWQTIDNGIESIGTGFEGR